ncbi:MAG: TIGR01212 family radical SAM protein [Planctomycetia bacterium]|nr:TIGR01212 family radical SAM protein [Planctomycetia bacterium]
MNLESSCQWQESGYLWYPLSFALKREFGGPVRKVSLDAGFSCPNRDGTVGTGGCIYCDATSFSPSRRCGLSSVTEQLTLGMALWRKRQGIDRFIAYFQPATNTYGRPEYLEQVYRSVMDVPGVVGLAIGTRPDTLPDGTLDLLSELSREIWLSLEIGLQSSKDASLRWMNRGHDYATFVDAVRRARARNLRIGAHVILGLPGETPDDMNRTADRLAALEMDSLKLHNLYVVRNTPLADLWQRGEVQLQSCQEYARSAVDFLERIPEQVVIDRVSSQMSTQFLLAPEWTSSRNAAKDAIEREFRRRKTRQGVHVRPVFD